VYRLGCRDLGPQSSPGHQRHGVNQQLLAETAVGDAGTATLKLRYLAARYGPPGIAALGGSWRHPGAAACVLPTRHGRVLRCAAALRVTALGWPGHGRCMTSTPRRQALLRLHTTLGTWTRYPFGVHYCEACDMLYDWWLGCAGRGRPPCDGRLLRAMIGLLRGLWS
jgi:hypothetical protein